MGRVVQLPSPPTQHVHIEAEIPGGFGDPITLFSAQPHCFMFELCCISLPLLCHHGTPPEIIISLFSRCPFLLNHNTATRWRPCGVMGPTRVPGRVRPPRPQFAVGNPRGP